MRSALTTKPARSGEETTTLSSWSAAKARVRSRVSSLVSRDVTSSTSRSTGAGLKKWRPTTCSGREVAMASFMMGMDDVFDARMAFGSVMTLSSWPNSSAFVCSSSTIASTTNSRSARSSRSAVNRRRPRASSRASALSFPLDTARPSDFSTRCRPAATAASSTSKTTASSPDRAKTSAMPDPIRPHPATATRVTLDTSNLLVRWPCRRPVLAGPSVGRRNTREPEYRKPWGNGGPALPAAGLSAL